MLVRSCCRARQAPAHCISVTCGWALALTSLAHLPSRCLPAQLQRGLRILGVKLSLEEVEILIEEIDMDGDSEVGAGQGGCWSLWVVCLCCEEGHRCRCCLCALASSEQAGPSAAGTGADYV